MLKKYLSFFCILILIFNIKFYAQQEWINISSTSPTPAEIKLINSNIKSSILTLRLTGFYINPVNTPIGKEYTVSVNGATPLLIPKEPDLPKISVPLIIPDLDEMEVIVIENAFKDFYNISIAPSKGNLLRTVNPQDVPYLYGNSYSKNNFFPEKIAFLDEPYIIRDFRGQTLKLCPFVYNPITKTLRVYYYLKVCVKSKGQNGKNQFIRTKQSKQLDNEFYNIYKRLFINFDHLKYSPLSEQGKMLIICYDNFANAMQPFVEWKNTIGIPTEIVNKSSIGTTASDIKNYVLNYYNTKGLTFLLLVGDAAQIPTNNLSSGPSDNAYGYLTGNDNYQEIIVGRFSAETEAQVTTMVDRTIQYEKTPNTTPGIYNKVIGIGSDQGPGDDNEYDYQHVRNMQTKMLNYTYTQKAELFDGSQGGLDASGNPTATMVANEVNTGAGCILYTGHGSETSFVTSGFSNSNVNNLTNQNKLPFIWAVACVNGSFVSNTCFAEAWLRAGAGTTQPKGAIATLMSTINQSWNPPMCGQDEMVDILVESYTNNIKRTFGGISVNGLFKMNDEYSTQGYEMTDTWTIFGDPSLMVRTDNPSTMNVMHPASLNIGASSVQINCNVNDAYVTLTINNNIIGTGYISNGTANISFPPLTTTDSIIVAVTAYNYIPYIGSIQVTSANVPYVSYKTLTINDATGNNNNKADYNENISLNVTLENSGNVDAIGVNASISTLDPFVTITQANHYWGTVSAGSQSLQNNAYTLTIANNVPNNHVANFTINIQDNSSNTWTNTFNIIILAPSISASNTINVNDAAGNNNHRLDPGENVILTIKTSNFGQSDALNTTATLTTTNPNITITNPNFNFGTISAGNSNLASFNINVDPYATIGSLADFTYTVQAGNYYDTKNYNLIIGLVDEDWETGDFNKFNWIQGGNKPW
ncbi:MAG TPA: C25 family cysteine peptidase, partial [Bacteroidales bacterium]|nr:C25 family cysteine peptidase [Bacteroidales bacterium]